MAVRKDEVQLNISFITDESKRYAKLIQDNKQFISDLISAQKKGQDVADTIKKIVDSGKGVADIDLTKLTPSQLVERARQLDQIMRRIPQSNPQYKILQANLKEINDQLVTTRAATRGVVAGLNDIPAAGGAAARIFESIAGTFGGLTLDNLVNQLVNYGSKLIGIGTSYDFFAQKTKTVFGDSTAIVEGFAQKSSEDIGLTRKEYANLATGIGDLLIPIGFAQEEAARLSSEVVNQAGILSQWSGGTVDTARAQEILRDAILGERDSLKTLGIQIDEELIKQELKKKGLSDLTGESLRQAEALITLEQVTKQSTSANEAFEKNSGGLVKTQAQLRARLAEVSETLAQALVPIAGVVLNLFSGLISVVVGVVQGFAALPKFISENKVALAFLVTSLIAFNFQGVLAAANSLRVAAAQKAGAIATNAWTVAQRLLNLAIKSNPIGLLIGAITGLVGLFVLAYTKSENFRASIQGLGNVAVEIFKIIGESFKAFGAGFNNLLKGNFKEGFAQIGEGIIKANPLGIAFTQGDRLKKSFLAGYDKSKLKDAQKKELEEAAKAQEESKKGNKGTGGKNGGNKDAGGTNEELFNRLKNSGERDGKALAAAAKEAFEARLKEVELAAGREEIVVEKQLLDRQISESAAGKRMLELKQKQYQEELAVYKQFSQLQTKEALDIQKNLQEVTSQLTPQRLEVQRIETRQPGQAQSNTKSTEQRIQEQSLLEEGLLRQKFANQVINELQFEEQLAQLRANQAERKLQALRNAGLQETDVYKKTLDEKIKLDDDLLKKQADNQLRTVELQRQAQDATLGITSDALSVGIELLSKDENARKKHAGAIKAFEIGQVLIDSTKEIAGIWRNANSNPLNALIPGWGPAFAAVQTGISLARTGVAVRKITATKYARGGKRGFFGGQPHSQGGTMGYFDDGTVVEVEKDEYFTVVNRRSSGILRGLSALNQMGGGVPFFQSGGLLKFENGGAFTTANTTPTVNLTSGSSNTNSTIDIEAITAEMRGLRMAFLSFPRELKAKVVYGEYESAAADISTIKNAASI
jgi:hypothetical protein